MKSKKLLLFVAILMIATVSVYAGFSKPVIQQGNEILPVRGKVHQTQVQPVANLAKSTTGVFDTLTWAVNPNTNFGGWTKDYFVEYFVPAADGILHSIAFNMSDLPDVEGGSMGVQIYDAKYAWPEISTIDIAGGASSWLGYFQEDTGKEPKGSDENWVFGNIKNVAPDTTKIYCPIGAQVWPFIGAASLELPPNIDDGGLITLDLMEAMSSTFSFTQGDTFMIVTRFNGFPDGGDETEYRMGYMASAGEVEPQPAMKFYGVISSPNGRNDEGDWGYYIREYLWDWRCNVEYTGDRGPVIAGTTTLFTTISTAARTVSATITDDNPSGGSAGVASAELLYTINGGDVQTVAMTASGDVYSADIPGQIPGTNIVYWLNAVDVEDLLTETLTKKYSIFEATSSFLFLYDASSHPYDWSLGYMYPYFYGYNCPADSFSWDQWNGKGYGPATMELLENYDVVYWVGGFYPSNMPNGPLFGEWLATGTAENPKRLLVTGQDYGVVSGFADTTFPAGTFEYDYLGIATLGAQDIMPGTAEIYALDPVEDDAISGYMFDFMGDSLQLVYDPAYLGGTNWIDNMVATDDATVFLTDPNNDGGAVGVRKEGAGFKAAYISVDPYCLNYATMADSTVQYSNTDHIMNILSPLLDWFEAENLGVDQINAVTPEEFKLSQNYPNPFNPTTNIEFSVPKISDVSITVYNMLGQKVVDLTSTKYQPGSYRVIWDGRDAFGVNVSTGVYIYQMTAGNVVKTNKMILMK